MKENLDARVLWKDALARWHNPSIPEMIVAETEEEINRLGEIGSSLKNELACGGTSKDNEIELQGDHRKRVKPILIGLGFEEEGIED